MSFSNIHVNTCLQQQTNYITQCFHLIIFHDYSAKKNRIVIDKEDRKEFKIGKNTKIH